jgi:hypothetical protein
VVESSGLLNRRRPLKSTGGSNPPLSAINNLQAIRPSLFELKTPFANPLLIRRSHAKGRRCFSMAVRRPASVFCAASSCIPGNRCE